MIEQQLLAIRKKIQSTEEELARLKTQLNTNSTEYVFSTEVLMKRLKDLQEQELNLQVDEKKDDGKSSNDENYLLVQEESNAVPERSTENMGDKVERLRLQLSQEDLGPDQIRVRVLTYILHSFQALLDQIGRQIKYGHRVEETDPAQIFPETELTLAASKEGHIFLLEIHIDPGQSPEERWATQILNKTMNLLNNLDTFPQLVGEIAQLDIKTHNLLKKWLGFMAEQKVQIKISWRKGMVHQEWTGNPKDFKIGLKHLEMIRVNLLEEKEMIVVIVGMNVRIGFLEFEEMQSKRIITANCAIGKLLQYRSCIGEKVQIRILKSVVENIQSGEVKITWIVNDCVPI